MMNDLSSKLINLIPQYIHTALDFLILLRPKAFAANVKKGDKNYLEPVPFMMISLMITAAISFTLAVIILQGEDRDTLGRLGLVGVTIITSGIWLYNLVLVFVGKLVAFCFGIRATLRNLIYGYCYSSILFPISVLAKELTIFGNLETSSKVLWVMAAAELFYILYLAISMARFAEIPPPFFSRFVIATPVVILITSVLLAASLDRYGVLSETGNRTPELILWNVYPEDRPTIRISNHTREPGCSDCWYDQVAAKKGEAISVNIYYHQSASGTIAKSARVWLLMPGLVTDRTLIGGKVSADNSSNPALGAVTLKNDGNEAYRLTFQGVNWYPGYEKGWVHLLRNQTGVELLTPNGLVLGDLDPGWEHSGYVTVRFNCE